jgi:hydrogenase maturation protein HypF
LYDFDDVVSFKKTFAEIINDLKNNITISDISAKFHNTLINVVVEVSMRIREKHHLNKVVLSGGTFQNKYLTENIETELSQKGFQVYSHSKVPTNDAGIALGQLMIAAARK